jgi:nicotinamidase-related amidase
VRGERTALLVVDMLNTYDHDDADQLAANVKEAVPPIAALIERARADEVAVVYVNDNYGDWNSSSEELAQRAIGASC